MFGIHLPNYLTSDPSSYMGDGFAMNLPAFLIVLFVASLLIKGSKEAAKANNVIVIMKVSAVVFIAVAGLFFMRVETGILSYPKSHF